VPDANAVWTGPKVDNPAPRGFFSPVNPLFSLTATAN
jgi:hypothetical protein